MVTYNFHDSQARDVIFGTKHCTLKPFGKRPHVRVGQMVHAFCGNVPPDYSKSPDCHRLITAPCTKSEPITVAEQRTVLGGRIMSNPDWFAGLAQQEGFADFSALQLHLDRMYGLPWEGQYIAWAPHKAEFRAQWPLIIKPPVEEGEGEE